MRVVSFAPSALPETSGLRIDNGVPDAPANCLMSVFAAETIGVMSVTELSPIFASFGISHKAAGPSSNKDE